MSAQGVRRRQQISELVRKHEAVKLDVGRAAQRVRRSGRLSVLGQSTSFELELTPHDLRADGYRAEETADGYVVPIEAGEVHTYKGRVIGVGGAEARFTVTEEKIEGVVVTPSENYYLQPLRDFDAAAAPTEFVLYKGSDVREEAIGECAVTLEGQVEQAATQFAGISPVSPEAGALAVTTLREAEVATEADYEYVQALGGSATANGEILGILNQAEGVYGNELGVTLRVVYQHTWAASKDPYNSTDPNSMLSEFRNYWNGNFGHVARDTAHMWTGRDMNGSTIGIAYLGVVCRSPGNSYGISQIFGGTVGKVALTAHEIGHNFNANHVTECPNTIMYPSLGSSTQMTFCQTSRDQVNSFIGGNGSCLGSVSPTPTPTPSPTPTPTPAPSPTPTPIPGQWEISGLVIRNGLPVPGAVVNSYAGDGATVIGSAATGADGRYRFSAADGAVVILRAPGYSPDGYIRTAFGPYTDLDFTVEHSLGAANDEGGQLKLLRLTEERVRDIMVIAKLVTVFDVFDEEPAALAGYD